VSTVEPLLDLRDLRKRFGSGRSRRWGPARPVVTAVDGVSLQVAPGETVGLVGESGSGKSTLARLALRLLEADGGEVVFLGRDIARLRGRALREVRRELQGVPQDVSSSLNPRWTVRASLAEPLHLWGCDGSVDERVAEAVRLVGLGAEHLDRRPHELSGGQRQRVAVARALMIEPRLVVVDEPVSALDVSTQSQVINLFSDLVERLGVAFLFIAHDLGVVHHVSDRIAVMYLGRVVECGEATQIVEAPRHPYTEALVSAIPGRRRSRDRIVLRGEIPSPTRIPQGCRFHTRCPYVSDVCREVDPEPLRAGDGGTVACHLHTSGPALAGAPLNELESGRWTGEGPEA
jgi:oligopeptide/dipeptide ABC transporter ATP-binding protein